ncbi:uncharacterized protein [Rutidosis leptorrhynchoides]|uniref:uncharacterized protein n=1 Tax=Rutidosis leptorrhynchoides TaxID=125765 RepID=UPI003A99249A
MESIQMITSPSPSTVFDFNYDNSGSTTPYATAPSSPQSTIPFTWEEKPGIPKQNDDFKEDDDTDFAFGCLERHSISAADELFDCGKIKPLKPPPGLHTSNDSPKSPKSPKLRFKEALSPRSRKKDFDPFSEALKQTAGESKEHEDKQMGRGRTTETSRRKVSRSLSPFRTARVVNDRENSTDKSLPTNLTWYNKWNLKNLLLFRSASEGSVTTRKDSLKKYMLLKKNQTFSFRSTDSCDSIKVSTDKNDFTVAKEEATKKANNLPYKSGLMGCLRFNQNARSVHEFSQGINSFMKG